MLGPVGAGTLTALPPTVLRHTGMANASAAVAVGEHWFVAASDEDNRLMAYRAEVAGGPVAVLELAGFAQVSGRSGELDLEGAARLDDLVFWIGSHSRSKDGRTRPNRQRLLATRITETDGKVSLATCGRPVTGLLAELLADPRCVALGLPTAAEHAPEDGGVNIEGLAATPDGHLLIGFRSPIPAGHALVVPLLNPRELIGGSLAKFGDPIQIDLEGLGIRDMVWTGREYFLIAGRSGSGGNPRLYRWRGPGSAPEAVDAPGFKHFNAEALAMFGKEKRPRLLVLSDDGHHQEPGQPPSFRSFWVKP